MSKNVLIPQFEGKDLLEGAEFKSFKRFKATLDYSLELIKMQEVYKKVFRNNRFVFKMSWCFHDLFFNEFLIVFIIACL